MYFKRSLLVFRNLFRPQVLAGELRTWDWKQGLGFAAGVHLFQVLVILFAVQVLRVDPTLFSRSFAEVDGFGGLVLSLVFGLGLQLFVLWPLLAALVWGVARVFRGHGTYVQALSVVYGAASVFVFTTVFQAFFFWTGWAPFSVLYIVFGGFYLWVLGSASVYVFQTARTVGLGFAAALAVMNGGSLLMSELLLRPNLALHLGFSEQAQDRLNAIADEALHDGLSEEARIALQMLRIMEHTCAQEDAESCTQLGLLYHSGEPALHIEASTGLGVKFLEKGCEFGGGEACFALASFAAGGGMGSEAMARIPDFLERACALGEKDACGYLDRSPASE